MKKQILTLLAVATLITGPLQAFSFSEMFKNGLQNISTLCKEKKYVVGAIAGFGCTMALVGAYAWYKSYQAPKTAPINPIFLNPIFPNFTREELPNTDDESDVLDKEGTTANNPIVIRYYEETRPPHVCLRLDIIPEELRAQVGDMLVEALKNTRTDASISQECSYSIKNANNIEAYYKFDYKGVSLHFCIKDNSLKIDLLANLESDVASWGYTPVVAQQPVALGQDNGLEDELAVLEEA